MPWNGGGGGGGSEGAAASAWTTSRKTAVTSRASTTTYADDPTLVFAMSANTTYTFRLTIALVAPDASGYKLKIVGPASPTRVNIQKFGSTLLQDYASTEDIAPALGGAVETLLLFEGVIENGANAGNLAVQWAQHTSNASAVSILAGSYIERA